jgi:hypothetical protein
VNRLAPRLLLPAAAAVLLLAGVGAALGYTLLRSSPAPLTLASSTAIARTTATPKASDPIAAACGSPTKSTSSQGLSGAWLVQPGGVAGYRAHEKWVGVTAPNDAVARTSGVRGWAVITDSSGINLQQACFAVDLMTLKSQDQVGERNMNDRDENVHDFLHARTYPYAIFRAANARLLGERPGGSRAHLKVNGSIEINGRPRPASLSVDVALNGDQLNLAGNAVVVSTDYGLELPTIGDFVEVDPRITVEFSVSLLRASGAAAS